MTSGKWDIHNHILYGIDDGASCMDETIELLTEEYRQGVRNIIFTPHFREHMFETPFEAKRETYKKVVEKYNSVLREKLPGMNFYLGCEFHVHPTWKIPYNDEEIRMMGKRIVLTEFSSSDTLEDVIPVVEAFHKHHIRCIIAHAERYRLKAEDMRFLRRQYGALIQLNASCILGKEGLKRMMLSRKILSLVQADFIASDAHDVGERPVLISECADFVEKKYGKRYAEILFSRSARKYFLGEPF